MTSLRRVLVIGYFIPAALVILTGQAEVCMRKEAVDILMDSPSWTTMEEARVITCGR